MAFVNEYITPEDREKYGLDELDKIYQRIFLPMSTGSDFTIDRKRDSYLRLVKLGRESEGEGNINYFSFLFKGNIFLVRLGITSGGKHREKATRYYELRPSHYSKEQELISAGGLEVFKEALLAFKTSGILSKCTSFEASFGF